MQMLSYFLAHCWLQWAMGNPRNEGYKARQVLPSDPRVGVRVKWEWCTPSRFRWSFVNHFRVLRREPTFFPREGVLDHRLGH